MSIDIAQQNVNKKTNQRVSNVDIARGLAVIYFMWCHAVNIHVAWVDTWAMPVFFLVMGIFFKPTTTWREMIVKKVNTIIIPFLLLSVPSFIQHAVTMPSREFAMKVINPFECVHGVGWFLVCIFWCYIVYYGILRIVKYNRIWAAIICLLLSIVSFYASTQRIVGYRIMLPMFLSTTLTVLPFIIAGDVLKDWIKKLRLWWEDAIIASVFLATSLGGALLLHFRGGEYIVNWFYNQPYWEIFLLSFLGTISVVFICKFLPRKMSFAGEHSLLLLMIHPYVLRIVRLFELPKVTIFGITLAISLLLIYYISKYLPVLEGKKQIIKLKS